MSKPLTMAKLRARICREPKPMEQLTRNLNGQTEFSLDAINYKRPKAPAPSPLLEPWFQMKSFSVCHEEKLSEELFSRQIVQRLQDGYAFLLPYYDYFASLEGDPDPRDAVLEASL